MVNPNLTFDDGEPIDISKLQKLYQIILDVQAQANSATSLYQGTVKMMPKIYAGTTGKIVVKEGEEKPFTLDYADASLPAGSTPRVIVTPRGSSKNIHDVSYYVQSIRTASADLMAKYKAKGSAEVSFDFIVISMQPISS